jgi:hypothetical protein
VMYHLTHRMMISWSKCRPLNRSCAEVGSVIPAAIAGCRAFQQFAPEPVRGLKAAIATKADAHSWSASSYLRRLGLGSAVESTIDQQAILDLVKINQTSDGLADWSKCD